MSLSPPVAMNPKPLSVSRLIVPSAICLTPERVSCGVARKHQIRAAPLETHYPIGWTGFNQRAVSDDSRQRAILESGTAGIRILSREVGRLLFLARVAGQRGNARLVRRSCREELARGGRRVPLTRQCRAVSGGRLRDRNAYWAGPSGPRPGPRPGRHRGPNSGRQNEDAIPKHGGCAPRREENAPHGRCRTYFRWAAQAETFLPPLRRIPNKGTARL